MKHKNILLAGLILFALPLSGCAERVTTHGQIIKTKHVEQIIPGQHKKEDVQYLLGSPSATGTFNANTWYYLSEKKTSTAIKKDMVDERRIITVTFNDQGVVKNVDDKTITDIRDISLNEHTTPTYGQSLGILDQMIENIGPGSF